MYCYNKYCWYCGYLTAEDFLVNTLYFLEVQFKCWPLIVADNLTKLKCLIYFVTIIMFWEIKFVLIILISSALISLYLLSLKCSKYSRSEVSGHLIILCKREWLPAFKLFVTNILVSELIHNQLLTHKSKLNNIIIVNLDLLQ